MYQLQDIFNLLPDVKLVDFVRSMHIKTNDQMLVVYLASLIRSVIALHNLIDNKIQNRDAEKNEGKDPKKEKKEEKGDGDAKKDEKGKESADKKAAAKSKKWKEGDKEREGCVMKTLWRKVCLSVNGSVRLVCVNVCASLWRCYWEMDEWQCEQTLVAECCRGKDLGLGKVSSTTLSVLGLADTTAVKSVSWLKHSSN